MPSFDTYWAHKTSPAADIAVVDRLAVTQRELAMLFWHSQELVSKVEKGERWATWYLATRCDAALRTGGVLARLWPAVERQRLASDRRRTVPARRAGAS